MLVITLASFLLPSAAYSQIPYLPNVQSSDGLVGSGGTAATTDFAIPNPATINIITKRPLEEPRLALEHFLIVTGPTSQAPREQSINPQL